MTMSEIFSTAIDYLTIVIESSYIYLIFLFCVLWLFFKTKPSSKKVMFLWGSLFTLFLFLCPVSGKIMLFGLHGSTYFRIFWLIPIVPLFCYTATDMLSRLKGRRRFLLFLVLLLTISQSGVYMMNESSFRKVENHYKIPQEVIDTADRLPDGAYIVGARWLVPFIREYNPTITLVNTRFGGTAIDAELDKEHPDLSVLGPLLQSVNCDFIAIGQDLNMTVIGKWEDYGFHFYQGDNRCVIFINENSSFYAGEP